jgi:hypothetical protein
VEQIASFVESRLVDNTGTIVCFFLNLLMMFLLLVEDPLFDSTVPKHRELLMISLLKVRRHCWL